MPTADELIRKRKQELLALGYKPGIVDMSMEWALGCAGGMVKYATRAGLNDQETDQDALIAQFLPGYLNDCERWMKAFGHEPGEVKPKA